MSEPNHITTVETCAKCVHFAPQDSSLTGVCYGLPPDVTAGGFLIERKLDRKRPACGLFKPSLAMETERLKAEAKTIVDKNLAVHPEWRGSPQSGGAPKGKRANR